MSRKKDTVHLKRILGFQLSELNHKRRIGSEKAKRRWMNMCNKFEGDLELVGSRTKILVGSHNIKKRLETREKIPYLSF